MQMHIRPSGSDPTLRICVALLGKQEKEIIMDQRNYYEIHSCLKDKETSTGFVVFQ